MTDDIRVALPGKEALMTSIEAMQRHFILVIYGLLPPVGEYYSAVESPKGELGWYIISHGESNAYRARCRPASFHQLAGAADYGRRRANRRRHRRHRQHRYRRR